MRLVRPWIAVVIMVAVARADGTDGTGGKRTDPSVKSAMDAPALTARIDAVLAARWAEAKIRPVPIADDGEFLRRVSLDLIGKIPTAAEARDFLDDPGTGQASRARRAAARQPGLHHPCHRDLATAPPARGRYRRRGPGRSRANFEAWLRKKVIEEAGYDRIVREILTAKLNGRNPDMNVGPARSFSRELLHGQGEQAREHRRRRRPRLPGDSPGMCPVPQSPVRELEAGTVLEPRGLLRRHAAASGPRTRSSHAATPDAPPIRELTIPGTKKVVKATHLDGSTPAWRPRADTREILAEWVTAPDNPYFARAVVNRVWARFFGVGLVEPVDDLDGAAGSELSGLLDELAVQFRAHGYNLKFLIRVLTATRAYNLSSVANPTESATPMFASMPVRGLSPGQLFDSLTQATGSESGDARARFLELFASRDERPVEAETTIIQALTMMNGSYIDGATNPETSEVLGAIVKAPFLDTPGRIETLYLATLTRRPKPDELAHLVQFVERRKTDEDRAKALADIFWAILNGPEFHLNH